MKLSVHMKLLLILSIVTSIMNCSSKNNSQTPVPTPPPAVNEVDFWLTKSDQSVKLEKQTTILQFGNSLNIYPTIEVNENETYQTVDGFGFSLTGGSAQVINQLSTDKKQELLQNLFGSGTNSIGVSYLRISIGASDLDANTFSYDDMPAGQTDINLSQFSIAPDKINLIPILKSILAINPNIKILGSPWSPPVWMKSANTTTGVIGTVGGSLLPQYYNVYAQYFVKFIQAMQAEGITIHAITPQNEPLHPGNNPSLLMLASEQKDFIKNNLGPAFQAAGINTKIIIYDHNCDKPEYPIEILNDATAKSYIAGSAFHLYAGDISALSTVHNNYPDKDVYFTEEWTSSTGDFAVDLKWHLKNLIIGAMRNWSKNVLEWNLASDASFNPHTPGGCTQCKGAITIVSSSNYSMNVSYYIIAHASKFVPPGSIRISSTNSGNIYSVAFKTPAGKKVLIVLNDGNTAELFNIKYNGRWIVTSLDKGSAGTYTW